MALVKPRSWREIEQDEAFQSLDPDRKLQVLDRWSQRARDFGVASGASTDDEGFSKLQSFRDQKAQEFQSLVAPSSEPSFGKVIADQFSSGNRSWSQGVELISAATGLTDVKQSAQKIAELERANQNVAQTEDMKKFQEADGFLESAGVLLTNPVDVGLPLFAQSMGSQLAPMAAGAVTGAAAGAVTGPGSAVTGLVGAGIGAGVGDAVVSFGDFIKQKGYDLTDPVQVEAALNDPDVIKEAGSKAAVRGLIVGGTSALGGAVAGRATAAGVSAAAGRSLAGRAASIGTGAAADMAVQTGLEGGGEAAAQLATTGKVDWKDVAAEMFVETPVNVAENLIGTAAKIKDTAPQTAAALEKKGIRTATAAAENAGVISSVDVVPDDKSVEQQAEELEDTEPATKAEEEVPAETVEQPAPEQKTEPAQQTSPGTVPTADDRISALTKKKQDAQRSALEVVGYRPDGTEILQNVTFSPEDQAELNGLLEQKNQQAAPTQQPLALAAPQATVPGAARRVVPAVNVLPTGADAVLPPQRMATQQLPDDLQTAPVVDETADVFANVQRQPATRQPKAPVAGQPQPAPAAKPPLQPVTLLPELSAPTAEAQAYEDSLVQGARNAGTRIAGLTNKGIKDAIQGKGWYPRANINKAIKEIKDRVQRRLESESAQPGGDTTPAAALPKGADELIARTRKDNAVPSSAAINQRFAGAPVEERRAVRREAVRQVASDLGIEYSEELDFAKDFDGNDNLPIRVTQTGTEPVFVNDAEVTARQIDAGFTPVVPEGLRGNVVKGITFDTETGQVTSAVGRGVTTTQPGDLARGVRAQRPGTRNQATLVTEKVSENARPFFNKLNEQDKRDIEEIRVALQNRVPSSREIAAAFSPDDLLEAGLIKWARERVNDRTRARDKRKNYSASQIWNFVMKDAAEKLKTMPRSVSLDAPLTETGTMTRGDTVAAQDRMADREAAKDAADREAADETDAAIDEGVAADELTDVSGPIGGASTGMNYDQAYNIVNSPVTRGLPKQAAAKLRAEAQELLDMAPQSLIDELENNDIDYWTWTAEDFRNVDTGNTGQIVSSSKRDSSPYISEQRSWMQQVAGALGLRNVSDFTPPQFTQLARFYADRFRGSFDQGATALPENAVADSLPEIRAMFEAPEGAAAAYRDVVEGLQDEFPGATIKYSTGHNASAWYNPRFRNTLFLNPLLLEQELGGLSASESQPFLKAVLFEEYIHMVERRTIPRELVMAIAQRLPANVRQRVIESYVGPADRFTSPEARQEVIDGLSDESIGSEYIRMMVQRMRNGLTTEDLDPLSLPQNLFEQVMRAIKALISQLQSRLQVARDPVLAHTIRALESGMRLLELDQKFQTNPASVTREEILFARRRRDPVSVDLDDIDNALPPGNGWLRPDGSWVAAETTSASDAVQSWEAEMGQFGGHEAAALEFLSINDPNAYALLQDALNQPDAFERGYEVVTDYMKKMGWLRVVQQDGDRIVFNGIANKAQERALFTSAILEEKMLVADNGRRTETIYEPPTGGTQAARPRGRVDSSVITAINDTYATDQKLSDVSRLAKRSGRPINPPEEGKFVSLQEGTQRYRHNLQVRRDQASALTEWAKSNGVLLDNNAFEARWQEQRAEALRQDPTLDPDEVANGVEHDVYFDEASQRWFKRAKGMTVTAPSMFVSYDQYFDRLAAHRALFPDTAMRLEGFVEYEFEEGGQLQRELAPVVSQPHIKAERGATREETIKFMQERGFKMVRPQDKRNGHKNWVNNEGVVVEDLHDENIVVTPEGEIKVIDPVIYLPESFEIRAARPRGLTRTAASPGTRGSDSWVESAKTGRELLIGVGRTGDRTQRWLAQYLLRQGAGDEIKVEHPETVQFYGQNAYGTYSQGRIQIAKTSTVDRGEVALHEMLHAYLLGVRANPETAAEKRFSREVFRLWSDANLQVSKLKKRGVEISDAINYGLSSEDEFIAQLANPEFRRFLDGLKDADSISLLDRFINSILSLLGINPRSLLASTFASIITLDAHGMDSIERELNMPAIESLSDEEFADLLGEPGRGAAMLDLSQTEDIRSARPRGPIVIAVTPQQDADYLEAVKRGDMETAQRMVDEAARRAGYTPDKWFHHGTAIDRFSIPSPLNQKQFVWFAKDKKYAERIGRRSILGKNKKATITTIAYLSANNSLDARNLDTYDHSKQTILRFFEDNGVVGLTKEDIDISDIGRGEPFYTVLARDQGKIKQAIEAAGYDSILLKEDFTKADFSRIETEAIAVLSPEQIKAAYPVTRDKRGNVIPLSERFNTASDDIRFARPGFRIRGKRVGGAVPRKPGGLFSSGAFTTIERSIILKASQKIAKAAANAEFLVNEFRRAVKKTYGKNPAPLDLINQALGSTDNRLTDQQVTNLKKIRDKDARELQRLQFMRDNRNAAAAARTNAVNQLPAPVAKAVEAMRSKIDELSGEMLNNGYIADDLIPVFDENLELYLHRSYAIFESPEWKNNMVRAGEIAEAIRGIADPVERQKAIAELPKTTREHVRVRVAFERFATERAIAEYATEIRRKAKQNNQTLSRQDAIRLAKADTATIERKASDLVLRYLTVADQDAYRFFVQGRRIPGRRDMDIIKVRGQVPKELREFWGEIKNAETNFTQTVSKLAAFMAHHDVATEMLNHGVTEGYIWKAGVSKDPNPDPEFVPLIPKGTASPDSVSPLYGAYGPVELRDALVQMTQPQNTAGWARAFSFLTAMSMAMKTIGYVPRSFIRNFFGNPLIVLGRGLFNLSDPLSMARALGDGFRVARLNAGLGGNTSYQALRERLLELGVIGDNVRGTLLKKLYEESTEGEKIAELLKRTEYDTALEKMGVKAAQGVYKGASKLADIYQGVDDIWKVYAWEMEKVRQKKAHPTWDARRIEEAAAANVRNLVPTYSLSPDVTQRIRRIPLFAPFITWTSEILRTTGNNIALAKQEIQEGYKTNNAAMRANGAARLAGFITATAALPAFAMAMKAAMGYDDEDEEAIRTSLRDWQKNAQLIFISTKDQGKVRFLDLSYLDPNQVFIEPLIAASRAFKKGDNPFVSWSTELLRPLFSEQLFVGAMADVMRNRTADGRPIVNDQDTPVNKTIGYMTHVTQAIGPGTLVSSVPNIIKGSKGEVSSSGKVFSLSDEVYSQIFGSRISDIDAQTTLGQAAGRYMGGNAEATQLLNDTLLSRGTINNNDIGSAYENANRAKRRIFEELRDNYNAALKLGVPKAAAISILRERKISNELIGQIVNDRYVDYVPTKQTFNEVLRRPDGRARLNAMRDYLLKKRQQDRNQNEGQDE